DKEIKTLEQLQSQAADLKDDLRELQHTALDNNLRWMDVELALATQDPDGDQEIIDGFETVEKKVGEFSADNEALGILQTNNKKMGDTQISGNWKNEKDVRAFAKKLFDIKDEKNIVISKSGKGADIPMFTVSYEDGKTVYMDVTQKGAHPLNIIVNREVKDKNI